MKKREVMRQFRIGVVFVLPVGIMLPVVAAAAPAARGASYYGSARLWSLPFSSGVRVREHCAIDTILPFGSVHGTFFATNSRQRQESSVGAVLTNESTFRFCGSRAS